MKLRGLTSEDESCSESAGYTCWRTEETRLRHITHVVMTLVHVKHACKWKDGAKERKGPTCKAEEVEVKGAGLCPQ